MRAIINKSIGSGRIFAPPSKSMAHRYLICGALTGGSLIKGLRYSEDIKATLYCLYNLGAEIKAEGENIEIGGLDLTKGIRNNTLNCNESGSTLRFLIPLCLLTGEEITLVGTERLFSRSLSVYEEICRAQGISFEVKKQSVTLKGKLQSGKYEVRGDVSSQFISGLMFALSLLPNDSIIDIKGAVESGSYLGLTVKALADFGVSIRRIDENTIYIKGGQSCKRREIFVEGDYSNAAFLDAFNLFGGNVMVKGLNDDSIQGDRVYKEKFKELEKGSPIIDVSNCPDLAPIFMAVAAAKNGACFIGTERLRIKESDRGAAMQSELKKLGCNVIIEENKIIVEKAVLKAPSSPIISHNDHRIVMALSVLLSLTGGEVLGAEAVSKSYPDFFKDLKAIGIDVEVIGNEIN